MRDFNVLVFSNGTPKDPLGRRSGQGDKQTLNSPNRPHPAPKPWPPAYSHQLYLLRLPRSPLMQGWEGSEESGSAVQGRVVGRSDTWPNSETPHAQHGWSLLAQIQMAPSTAPSSHLPSPPGSSLGFFFPTAPEQVSPKSPKKEKKKKNPVFRASPGWCMPHPSPPRMRLRGPRQENWVRAIPTPPRTWIHTPTQPPPEEQGWQPPTRHSGRSHVHLQDFTCSSIISRELTDGGNRLPFITCHTYNVRALAFISTTLSIPAP